jgi:hypothetical protein
MPVREVGDAGGGRRGREIRCGGRIWRNQKGQEGKQQPERLWKSGGAAACAFGIIAVGVVK